MAKPEAAEHCAPLSCMLLNDGGFWELVHGGNKSARLQGVRYEQGSRLRG